MLPVLTAAQMQQIDKATISGLGLPGTVLMENAGRAVADSIRDFPATRDCRRPLILCGKGNNGGDGFVVARYLLRDSENGFPLVLLCGRLEELSGDAAVMAGVAAGCGVKVVELEDENLDELARALESCDLVVDALLGSGAAGAPRGLLARVIGSVGEYARPLVAIDSPSGVDMDTGGVPGCALCAVLTVTFGFEKVGHRFYPGRSHCGQIVVADIGFPDAAARELDCRLFVCEPDDVSRRIPLRRPNSNKGDYGKLLVLGGSTGLTGAAVLCSEAAMASGAGMVTAGVPQSLNSIFEIKLTEVMTLPLPDDGTGALQMKALEEIDRFLRSGMDVLALGPGIGRDPGTVDLIRALAGRVELPVVIDADGLNAFAGFPDKLSDFRGPVVITPHPGEMSRLCGKEILEIKANPVAVAREFAERTGAVVLLKGPPTVTAEPGGRAVINPTGTAALAKAGSGDVLTGIIAGLLAQGVQAFDAAFVGAYLHGLAGETAEIESGPYSVMALDLVAALPLAIEKLK